jgi:hypothetical protein
MAAIQTLASAEMKIPKNDSMHKIDTITASATEKLSHPGSIVFQALLCHSENMLMDNHHKRM